MTPSLPAAESRLATVRALHDGLVSLLWDAQGYALAEAATGAVHADTLALVAGLRDLLARIESVRDEAFALVAALRSAASSLRLVPRELTGDEVEALAEAERAVAEALHFLDHARALRDDAFGEVMAAASNPLVDDVMERGMLCIARSVVDMERGAYDAAFDARAPLLAARWQEAS